MKTIFKILVLFIAIATINSCSNDDEDTIIINQDISISPDNGPKNTVVTITGIAFGTDINKVKVFFNDTEAEVLSVIDSKIEAVVPAKAGTGLVKVMLDGADNFGPEFTYVLSGVVTTFAGKSGFGSYVDGEGSIARFHRVTSVAVGPQGTIFVAEGINRKIRKITPEGIVSTFVGTTQGYEDGEGANVKFYNPKGMTVDNQGNVYVIDHQRVRKVTPAGVVSTLAGSPTGSTGYQDGQGADAKFFNPAGITVDAQGNLYLTDISNHKIRKITPDGTVSTVAGSSNGFADGTGTDAKFSFPRDVAVDKDGNLFVADEGNYKIRKITPDGVVSTFAGNNPGYADGNGPNARFKSPYGIEVDENGNVYVADLENYAIRKITPEKVVTTLAGGGEGSNDGDSFAAQFKSPSTVAIDKQGNIFIGEIFVHVIRKIIEE